MTELWALGLVFIATVIGSFGSLLLKFGSKDFNLNIFKLLKNYKLILGLFIYVFTSVLFIIALKGGELSVLYPITSLTYVWISLLSIKYLNEKMNKFKWLGILIIMAGVALIGIGS